MHMQKSADGIVGWDEAMSRKSLTEGLNINNVIRTFDLDANRRRNKAGNCARY